jgi:hypothetical protein
MTPFARPIAPFDRPAVAPAPSLSELLRDCPAIRALWSLDHPPGDTGLPPGRSRLLAFADLATLRHLRMREDLHRTGVELLVVLDGNRFESAWGSCRRSGPLGGWAWRQTSARVAYYDEVRRNERGGEGGNVVRVRRKALLLCQQ